MWRRLRRNNRKCSARHIAAVAADIITSSMVGKRVQLKVQWFQRLIGQTVRVSRLVKRWLHRCRNLSVGSCCPQADQTSGYQSETAHCNSAFRQLPLPVRVQGEAENDSGPAPAPEDDLLFLELYYRGWMRSLLQ